MVSWFLLDATLVVSCGVASALLNWPELALCTACGAVMVSIQGVMMVAELVDEFKKWRDAK